MDGSDIESIAGNFTGAMPGGSAGGPAGNKTDGPNNADLIYHPATGNVKLDASEAAGARIVSFQLENGDGTFVPGNYISLAGGVFGRFFEDVGTNVFADSDLLFYGVSGVNDIGNVFPTGMDLDGLHTYLTTALYTGQLGTGQHELDLVVILNGDFDGDGDVDNADIGLAAGNFTGSGGTGMSYCDGDIDGDGDVDNADIGFVAGAFTGSSAGNLTGMSTAEVPEPATLFVMMAAGLPALLKRRRS